MIESKVKPKKQQNQQNQQNKKNQKAKQKSVAKKMKKNKMGFIALSAFIIIAVVLTASFLNNMAASRNKKEKISELTQEYEHLKTVNDALQQIVEAPTDDEYIREIAKKHRLRDSNEIIFYLNDGD